MIPVDIAYEYNKQTMQLLINESIDVTILLKNEWLKKFRLIFRFIQLNDNNQSKQKFDIFPKITNVTSQ